MADGRVLNLAARLDRAHHDFTGIDADADFERMGSSGGVTLAVLAQLLLYLECRIQRALRMVLVSGRCTEQC